LQRNRGKPPAAKPIPVRTIDERRKRELLAASLPRFLHASSPISIGHQRSVVSSQQGLDQLTAES
jgi:hypothetical protein